MSRLAIVLAAVVALGLAACGDDDDSAPDSATGLTAGEQKPEATAGEKPITEPKPGIEITTAGSDYGEILFDADDRAIYLFDKETSDRPQCYDGCAEAWPPVLTDGPPEAAGDVDPKLLGTTERDDGTAQVTYGGHPLYYYVDDPPGEVLCHNVEEFGGLWLVVGPGGDAVQ